MMIDILIVSKNRSMFSAVTDYLNKQEDIRVVHVQHGAEALDIVGDRSITLVISGEDLGDMTGLEFARRLVAADPLAYCALASPLTAEGFHEASEGLGLLAQLPVSPVESDGEAVLNKLRRVIQLNQPLEL